MKPILGLVLAIGALVPISIQNAWAQTTIAVDPLVAQNALVMIGGIILVGGIVGALALIVIARGQLFGTEK